jgi:predicted tellurium resistance membrane protein TerC
MELILFVVVEGLLFTSIDLDNAMYITSVISNLPGRRRGAVIAGALLLEFVGRLGLILLFVWVVRGDEPLFTLFGLPVTVEMLSLFAAGLFLSIRNGRQLINFFRQRQDEPDKSPPHPACPRRKPEPVGHTLYAFIA